MSGSEISRSHARTPRAWILRARTPKVWSPRAVRMAVLVFLGSGALASAPGASAQTEEEFGSRIVNILQEPRHRTVHRDGDVYLLDVQINPGDTTLAHTHDAAIMYTFISLGRGSAGGRVSSNTDYVAENFTHRVSNDGPDLFRIIALTNYGPPVSGMDDRPNGLEGDPQLENEWFRSYRVELEPGEATPEHRHGNPTVVVQVSDGLTHVTREDGITAELAGEGDWAWRDPGSPYAIHNVGEEPVSIVVHEARRAGSDR